MALIRTSEMHSPNQGRVIVTPIQIIGPSGDIRTQNIAIMPYFVARGSKRSHETHPTGNAQWSGTIGVRKFQSFGSQPIKIGCSDLGIAITTQHTLIVLIRHNDKNIRSCSVHFSRLPKVDRCWRGRPPSGGGNVTDSLLIEWRVAVGLGLDPEHFTPIHMSVEE